MGDHRRIFAEQARAMAGDDPVARGMCVIGMALQEYLETAIVDAGTHVDKGFGLGSFDLWPTVGGTEYHIEIKQAARAREEDRG